MQQESLEELLNLATNNTTQRAVPKEVAEKILEYYNNGLKCSTTYALKAINLAEEYAFYNEYIEKAIPLLRKCLMYAIEAPYKPPKDLRIKKKKCP